MCRQFLCLIAALFCVCVFAIAGFGQESPFHINRQRINDKTDLLTVFGKLDSSKEDLPLVSVLVETMEDDDPLNDRPRYVWSLTYSSPDVTQRLAAAIPFFYHRSVSKRVSENRQAPPPIFDFKASRWRAIAQGLWQVAQITVLDDQGFMFRAMPRGYNRNSGNHQKDHLHRALATLYLLESSNEFEQVISTAQLQEIQARLALSGGLLGRLVKRDALDQIAQKQRSRWEQSRGRNWELLRQRAEAEGLYFEPLAFPDGSATHALLWVAKEDLNRPASGKFDKRFLNIADPHKDKRLINWKSYVDVRWLDVDNRPVSPETPGARRVELIPLALYGLNHPRVPALLIDFRDTTNPKVREISRRAIDDVSRSVIRLSPLRQFPLWAAKKAFDFVTHQRGADFNQPSRLKSYAELDLLLMLDDSIKPELRAELIKRMQGAATNPMENSLRVEIKLAQANYEALLASLRKRK